MMEKKGKKWIFEWKGRLEDQENRNLGEEQRYTWSGLELGSMKKKTVWDVMLGPWRVSWGTCINI